MFRIELRGNDEVVLAGRFDAAQVEKANHVFDKINLTCTVDFENLDYISSGGLSVLLATQKRLSEAGHELRLKHMNRHADTSKRDSGRKPADSTASYQDRIGHAFISSSVCLLSSGCAYVRNCVTTKSLL